ncbi:FAD-binding protein [Fusarium denticulatum]|uniref:FAD-binding protein n=1 Tax=Fusarium denticulatum TaxID=48507 RepID=A0A8H5XGR6_9HYPO|nr:FAD-binding protein [Fusarium denticulatum]
MTCCGNRKKQVVGIADQKWEYINLRDFKSRGCGTVFAYIYLWLMLLVSVAVYVVDSFTAVNLLVFDRWSSKIDPAISFDVTKWIFSICIILSFINLAYEGFRAFRVIRRGNVAESYLDSLAVRWESIRLGSQGWKRFLVFAELTKSKEGAQYIALFTYFNFQAWIRVIICSGPRQVLNAFTLKSVYEAQLTPTADNVGDSITGFFEKIKILAEEDYQQALILSGMCFTLVIWVFSALFLLAAVLFWVFFLYHWIPAADGGLSGYCERKVTKALMKIVTKTVNKALAREEASRFKAEIKAAKKNGEKLHLDRAATLPTLPNVGPVTKMDHPPMLNRNDTMMTLPPYTSRPGTPGGMENAPPASERTLPSRQGTTASIASYASRATSRSGGGYGRIASPVPDVPPINYQGQTQPRSATDRHDNFGPYPPNQMAIDPMTTLPGRFTESPGPMNSDMAPFFPPPTRAPSARPIDTFSQPVGTFPSAQTPQYQAYNPGGRMSTASSVNSHQGGAAMQRPFNPPVRSATGPMPFRGPPQRNLTNPMPPRAASARPERAPPYNYDVESQRPGGCHLLQLYGSFVNNNMPSATSEWHEGELAVQKQLKVPRRGNPTFPGLAPQYGMRVMQSPLVALGTLDSEGRPWATVWGGDRGFARPVAEGVLAFNSSVDTRHDPVFRALWDGIDDEGVKEGAINRPNGGEGKGMAGLSIDLETRDRVKLVGNMIAGATVEEGKAVQMAMAVTESLGNCPKYLNKKDIVPNEMAPELVSDKLPLSQGALDLVAAADMFFLSSTNGVTMDTNHRGGSPGFMRIIKNEKDGLDLIYPEFSGNRLYQTLGNFRVNPLVGIAIPDYNTANVLYATGSASILVGDEASSYLARTKLAVKISITAAKFVKSGLPFRGALGEYSPYNPPVRHLLSEHDAHIAEASSNGITASLTKREVLTTSIDRYTFELSSTKPINAWHAGQYITLDFEQEVSGGYSHMADHDPQSINDDYVRTFTVSSSPENNKEVQITTRKHGPVTSFLRKHNPRVPLEIPVIGFGGEEGFRIPLEPKGPQSVFIAAGVGITPVLAQAPAVLQHKAPFVLLWTLRYEDLPLASDTFSRIPGLSNVTTLFVTGQPDKEDLLEDAERAGTRVVKRRIGADDVERFKGQNARFFLCTAPALLAALEGWLLGEKVVWEDFGY